MAPSFDQVSGLSFSGNTTQTQQTVTWSVNPTAGAKVVLGVVWKVSTVTISSVVDNGTTPTTFTASVQEHTGSGSSERFCQLFYADNITLPSSGSYIVTITFSTTTVTFAAGGASYLGVASGDPAATQVATGAASTAPVSGSVSDAKANCLYVGIFDDSSSNNPETVSYTGTGNSRLLQKNGSAQVFGFADHVAATGSQQETWSTGDSVTYVGCIAVWEAAPSPSSTDPPAAKFSPAWQNQFGPLSRNSKSSVLFDQQLTFTDKYLTAGDLAFGSADTAYKSPIGNDPIGALPGPAWQNQFLPERLTKQAVLFDYQLSIAASYLSAGDIAFGAVSVGYQSLISPVPYTAQVSPAWENRFLPERLSKQAVLYDYQLSLSGSYVNGSGDISFGSTAVGVQTFTTIPDYFVAQPGPAWANQFFPERKSKQAVLYDYQLSLSGSYVTAGDLAFGALSSGYQSLISPAPFGVQPGPAWENQFQLDRLSKQAVLYDYQLSLSGSYVNAGDIAFSAISSGYQSLISPAIYEAQTSPAWQNQFLPERLTKQAVLFDYQLSIAASYVTAGDIAFGATAIGFAPVVAVTPDDALVSPTWHNFFKGQLSKQAVLTDYQLTFAGNYSSAGDITFGSTSVGYQSLTFPTPYTAHFSPAWKNRFLPERRSKQTVLFDYQLSIAGVYNSAGDLAFGSTSIGLQVIQAPSPLNAQPGPAWQNVNVFGPLAGARKSSVLYDEAPFDIIASYSNPSGDIVFGTIVNAFSLTSSFDPTSALPGQAWQNQFQPDRLTKQAVLFDYQLTYAAISAAGISSYDATLYLSAKTVGASNQPQNIPWPLAEPGPAWQNFFKSRVTKTKHPVLFDGVTVPPSFGPFCFSGTEVETNLLGGTQTETNLLGGSIGDENLYGGTAYAGCFADMQAVNITLGEFNDETIDLTITNNGSPFNLAGYGLQALFKTAPGVHDDDTSTLVLSTANGGITITSNVGGTATLVIPNADLQNTNFTFWRVDVTIAGTQATAMYGTVTMRQL